MKIIQAFKKPIPKLYRMCINQVKSVIPDGVGYTLLNEDFSRVNESFSFQRRIFELLVEDPDRFWIDADMLIPEWFDFDFEPGKPYVYGGSCAISAIYANGCADVIDRVLLSKMNDNKCSHWNIKNAIDEFNIIPRDSILHLHLGSLLRFSDASKYDVNGNFHCKIVKDGSEYSFYEINGFDISKLN